MSTKPSKPHARILDFACHSDLFKDDESMNKFVSLLKQLIDEQSSVLFVLNEEIIGELGGYEPM